MKIHHERITRLNAMAVKHEMINAAQKGDALLDLSLVSVVDSSAVALVLAWMRAVQTKGLEPRICGVPEKLVALMKLYGTYALIGKNLQKKA